MKVEYIRSFLPGEGNNGEVACTYTLEEVPPFLRGASPSPGTSGAALNSSLTLLLEDLHSKVNPDSLDLTIDSKPAIVKGSFMPGFKGRIKDKLSGLEVYLDPDEDFKPFQTVTVGLEVWDRANIPNVLKTKYRFLTGDKHR
jgi:hypothetical protein